mgnify:FL=1|jgi:hypothetical protein
MKPVELTKQEMVAAVKQKVETASIAEYRWMYSYLHKLEEWPLLTDYQVEQDSLDDRPLASGEGTWGTGEECPF